MKRKMKQQVIIVALLVVLALSSLTASANIRLEGVKGEATDAGHDKWVILDSITSPSTPVPQPTPEPTKPPA